jgi:hypothetical protein
MRLKKGPVRVSRASSIAIIVGTSRGIIDSRESRFVDDRINLQKDGMEYLSSGKLLLRCKLATRWWHQPKKRNLKPLKGSYPEETEKRRKESFQGEK